MKNAIAALLLVLFQDSVSREEVVRLTKEGASEAAILGKIGGAKFRLSADDVVELKKAGVGEKVIARMVEGPREAKVTNLAHKAVAIRVVGTTIEVGDGGEKVERGATLSIPASGEYAVSVYGSLTACTVKTPATLTFRGCDLDEFEVVTLYVEDARGSDTCRVETRLKR